MRVYPISSTDHLAILPVTSRLWTISPRCVEQLLDLWILCLGFRQYFTDELHQPLDRQSMSLFLSFHNDGYADDLGHGCHV